MSGVDPKKRRHGRTPMAASFPRAIPEKINLPVIPDALCDDRCKLSPSPSWPGLTRPSTRCRWCADGRVKPGHDGTEESVQGASGIRSLNLPITPARSVIALTGEADPRCHCDPERKPGEAISMRVRTAPDCLAGSSPAVASLLAMTVRPNKYVPVRSSHYFWHQPGCTSPSIVSSPRPAVNPGLSGHRLRRLTGLTAGRGEEGVQLIGVSLIVAKPGSQNMVD